MSDSTMKAVRFCYQCGRRVGKGNDHCWYCDAPVREFVRPPKLCPFCKEAVQAGAVKCKHCGEFIDGRPRSEERPSQIIFVVDKELLRAAHDARLIAGQPVPLDVARVLDAQTVRAIEAGQPALVHAPGVRALPAPGPANAGIVTGDIVDTDAEEVPPARRATPPRSGAGRDLVRRAGDASQALVRDIPASAPQTTQTTALTRSDATPPARASEDGFSKAFGALTKWKPKPKPETHQHAHDPNTVEADAHDLFRVCERCGADILVSDNYCYHCGMQYRLTKADVKQRRKYVLGRAARTPYALALLVTAVFWAQKAGFVSLPMAHARLALAGAAALLVAIGVLRGRGLYNWFAAGVTAVILLAAIFS